MGRNIELPDEMPRGVAAVVTAEWPGGRWRSLAFDDEGDARAQCRVLRGLGCNVRLERVELVAVYFADGDGTERLRRREREAYEAFLAADWRTAAERLGEWLDAWRELRGAREEGEA